MPKTFRIGNLAYATGTKVETIRYYERIGLLPPPERTAGNYRLYSEAHYNRLSFIRRGRTLGFSLDDLRTLLRLADDKNRSCADVDAMARTHLAEVERKIEDLSRLRNELEQMIAQCSHGTVAECRILESLVPRERPLRDSPT